MKNYFEFLSESEQNTLTEHRLTNDLPYGLRLKVREYLARNYDTEISDCPVPTNHQLDAFAKMRCNLAVDVGFFAELMEQGLGKTKLAIMYAEYLYRYDKIDGVVVIAPNDLKYQWVEEELPLHYPEEFAGSVWDGFGSQTKRIAFHHFTKTEDRLKVFAINVEAFSSTSIYQYLRLFTQSCKDVLVIIDESTSIKNGRRKPVGNRERGGAKRANTILDGFRARKYKLILTGTATPNRPFDLWSQYEFLCRNYFGLDYWDFCRHYGEMVFVRHGSGKQARRSLDLLDEKTFKRVKHAISKIDPDECAFRYACKQPFCDKDSRCEKYRRKGFTPTELEQIAFENGLQESAVLRIHNMEKLEQYKHLDELKSKMLPSTFFCKTNEVMDMPPQIYETVQCSMSAEQRRVYNEMTRDMMATYEGSTITTLYKQVMYIRAQQISGGLFPFPVEVIRKGLDGDINVLERYDTKPFKNIGKLKSLEATIDDLDPELPKLYWAWFVGEQDLIYTMLKEKYGSQCVGLYRGGNKEVVDAFKGGEILHLVSSSAGAYGLNLQVCGHQFFYSNSWQADVRDQKEKRSHRIGRIGPVVYTDMVCRGTKDAKILEVLKQKLDLMDYFRSGGE